MVLFPKRIIFAENNLFMIAFTDREEESSELLRVLGNGKTGQLTVVYGRRRLGKSTLIKHVLKDSDVYYMAGKYSAQVQMDLLKEQLSVKFPVLSNAAYSSWDGLLTMVNSLTTEPFTVCLDEFPYMVKSSPELPSVLQKLIDSKTLKYNIIICGSSQRMMNGIILSANEPLYGRSECTIKLQPIAIPFLQKALSLSPIETIEEYSVWGGVPRYWELREERASFIDAVSGTLLTTNGVLFGEPERLLLDDIEDTALSESIMSVVASGANRLSEIAGRLGKNATTLSLPLKRLIDMGYLRREVPFGESEKKSKKGIYLINDPLMDFYYHFVVPNTSNISRGRNRIILQQIEARHTEYVSRHWEHLCREAISGNNVLGLWWKEASRWWGNILSADDHGNAFRPVELDIVAESTDNKHLLIGECKWTKEEDAGRLINELKAKTEKLPFAKGKTIVHALFLKEMPKNADKDVAIFLPKDVINMFD